MPSTLLDLSRWHRRAAHDLFRTYDNPYFNVCARIDVAALKAALAGVKGGTLGLACYHLALRLANAPEHEAFRLRLRGNTGVCVHDAVDGSTTVLRDDGSFAYAALPYEPAHADFSTRARRQIAAVRAGKAPTEADRPDDAVLHFTTLPWIHFTSFSHARNWRQPDAIPKFAFGRADAEGARLWLPLSVEVHHALMDGVHLGHYLQHFEQAAQAPSDWLLPAARP